KLAILLLIVVVFLGEISKDPQADNPRFVAPAEKTLPPLPAISAEGVGEVGPPSILDPVIVIEDEVKGDRQQFTGTAFSIDPRGLWVTARHVTNGCSQLLLLRPHKRALKVENLVEHARSDVSIIQTSSGVEALPIDYSTPQYNQEGFHYGFPRGEPGAVYSNLIGRRTIKTTGSRRSKEAVHVWAERIRVPNSDKSLGGISGGPILNKQGSVVGIHVAGSIRRGRSFSSMPKNIDELLVNNNVELNSSTISPADITSLNATDFARVGEELRGDLTVAQVICRTN
ncbi:MAG: trypsin-like peptidase domain-containing protein, partial [Kordiimonadaceae bacterium]|nr:trypsin-like peptidase domain-containing protein [Kordiimonadaceae bacterium]